MIFSNAVRGAFDSFDSSVSIHAAMTLLAILFVQADDPDRMELLKPVVTEC